MLVGWSRSSYKITIGGTDISSIIAPILLSVTVEDKDKSESDTASIVLDDGGGRVVLPEKGAAVTIHLGTTDRGVIKRFEGTVDTVRWSIDRGSGSKLTIGAKSVDGKSKAKEPKQKHWDNAKLKDVVLDAAKLADIDTVIVHKELKDIIRPYWVQDNESFIAFAQRVAREVGATFKVRGKTAIIAPKNAGVSASGKPLAPIRVSVGTNLISADISPLRARPEFKRIKSRHYDIAKSKWVEEVVEIETAAEDVKAEKVVTFSRPDGDEARHAAKAEAADSERDKGGGRIDIVGDPTIVAGATCILSGCRDGIDGEYKIEGVTDTLDRSRGYITSLDLVFPDKGAGTDKRKKSKKAKKV